MCVHRRRQADRIIVIAQVWFDEVRELSLSKVRAKKIVTDPLFFQNWHTSFQSLPHQNSERDTKCSNTLYTVSSHISEIRVQHVGDAVKLNFSAGGLPLPKVTLFKNVQLIFPKL